MAIYRKYNWPILLEEFESSGLTQTQFCKDKNINPRYFSLRRSKYIAAEQSSFTKVELETTLNHPSAGVTIEVGRCKIQCPPSLSAKAIAELVHSLAWSSGQTPSMYTCIEIPSTLGRPLTAFRSSFLSVWGIPRFSVPCSYFAINDVRNLKCFIGIIRVLPFGKSV